ncbi:integration host factor subunit beta [Cupriavidus basilensis OR16]|uniref:Integration host factor subunit beta n=1 Tax=Cupriavidus basilensis OR16 TaxID=1127483 RepID=H1S4S3_9BURK|nr:integration host factor subunit beta [Cupriavidus basilensis OR16]
MTKSELVEKLAARFPQLLLRDADISVKTILDAMSEALADGHRIEIRGFGSFGLNRRPPRVGRNPKSGERVLVPEKRVPHFKAGKELRERVDRSPALPQAGSGGGAGANANASHVGNGNANGSVSGNGSSNGHGAAAGAGHVPAHGPAKPAAVAGNTLHDDGGLKLAQS